MIHSMYYFPLSHFPHLNFFLPFSSFIKHQLILPQPAALDAWIHQAGLGYMTVVKWFQRLSRPHLPCSCILEKSCCKENCAILLNPAFSKHIYLYIYFLFREYLLSWGAPLEKVDDSDLCVCVYTKVQSVVGGILWLYIHCLLRTTIGKKVKGKGLLVDYPCSEAFFQNLTCAEGNKGSPGFQ